MTRILIDGTEYPADPRHNLLQATLSLGHDLPYFCWHPELGSVGSCRQCAVTQYADAEDTQGKVVMACMTPVQDGMRIGLRDPQSSEFRAGIIEALMTNHPHDCPVCEEGGECHLQDMTEMSGHTFRRYRGLKRTHRNQYLGPFINHEMNRCIACYRCVRFYQDYAGGRDLSAQAAHHHVYFGREKSGVLESPFSGNLVEVCPTGVFTDKTYSRHYARKWDLQSAPSVCAHCAVGCNTTPAERYGRVVRITNRYHHHLNGYFLCDRGRFGYDFSNAPERIEGCFRPAGDALEELDSDGILADLAERIRDPAHTVLGIGSPRASLEDNFALKSLVGEGHFYAGIAGPEWQCLQRHRGFAARSGNDLPTLRDIEAADAALVIGEDLSNTAPRVALALRQMVRNRGIDYAVAQGVPVWQDAAVRSLGQWYHTPLWQLLPQANALSELSEEQCIAAPGEIAAIAAAIAHALDRTAPQPPGLTEAQQEWAQRAARMLLSAQRPVLLGGCGAGDPLALDALANIERALCRAGIRPRVYPGAAEANSVGLAALAEQALPELLNAVGSADGPCTLVVLENDLQRRLAPGQFRDLRRAADHWLLLDYLLTGSARHADAVLAVPTPFEKQGTLVNASAISQRFFAVHSSPDREPAWRQLAGVAARTGHSAMAAWRRSEDVRAGLAATDAVFSEVGSAAPGADHRVQGLQLRRQSHRYSGRTAMHAHEHVSEAPPPPDPDSPYTFSMEGTDGPGPWRAAAWAPGWNSEQALNKFQQEVGSDWREPPPLARLRFPGDEAQAYAQIPAAQSRSPEPGWRAQPRYEVFGSEELSRYADAVVQRGGPATLNVDTETAREFALSDWASIELHSEGESETLYVTVDPSLPARTVAVPQQRLSLWVPAFTPEARVELRPARNPLPRPPQVIASDLGDGTQ